MDLLPRRDRGVLRGALRGCLCEAGARGSDEAAMALMVERDTCFPTELDGLSERLLGPVDQPLVETLVLEGDGDPDAEIDGVASPTRAVESHAIRGHERTAEIP